MAVTTQANSVWCCSKCGAIYHKDYPRCPNDGAEIVLTRNDPLLGKRIDNYVIDAMIGEGGMGRVYRAHHANLPNKRYAIKVLLGDVAATGSMRKRFVKEAEIASRLDHPNLVGVVDFGATDTGLPYIAMDFVDGELLTEILDRGPMEWSRVVKLTRGICEGVAYAHDAGLIHRDLKPDNVIVVAGPNGEVPRLMDFGLVMTTERTEERLTSTGMAMGTPAYAAPEQMAGKPLDLRADLFSLGMSMFEMLTGGKLPWEGGAMEIAAAKAHKDAPPISVRVPELTIPPPLELLVARLLRRDRDERPPNARAVIELLDGIGDAPAITDTNPIIVRSHKIWLVPAAIVAIGLGIGGWQLFGRSHDASSTVVAAPVVPGRPAVTPKPAPPAVVVAGAPLEPDAITQADPPPANPIARETTPQLKRPNHRARPSHSDVIATTERTKESTPKDPPPRDPIAVAPPPNDVRAPPPPKPVELRASLTSVDVHGSLPEADVERAVRRVMPAIERCAPKQIERIVVELKIGESRRAEAVQASGGTAGACVAGALGAMRTETAPDVGEVTVIVRVAFVEKF